MGSFKLKPVAATLLGATLITSSVVPGALTADAATSKVKKIITGVKVTKSGKLISTKTGKSVKGIVSYKGKVYKNGKKASGVVGGYYYKNGKKATGLSKGVYYKNGVKGTGTYKGILYSKGKKAQGLVKGIYYKAGKKATSVIKGTYYKNGKKASGLYKGVYYEKGKALTDADLQKSLESAKTELTTAQTALKEAQQQQTELATIEAKLGGTKATTSSLKKLANEDVAAFIAKYKDVVSFTDEEKAAVQAALAGHKATVDATVQATAEKIVQAATKVAEASTKIAQVSKDAKAVAEAQSALEEAKKAVETVKAISNVKVDFSSFDKALKDAQSAIEKNPSKPTTPTEQTKPEEPTAPVTPPTSGSVGGGTSSNSSGAAGNSTSKNKLESEQAIDTASESVTLSKAGTYGGTKEKPQTIEGNVTITSDKVNLSNVIIKGNLTITDGVGSGDVIINNVKVEGKTYINGGGMNSIHFQDSVIATVIVNKNDGKVRVVVTGGTVVKEVRLESYAKLQEENLTGNAEGFTDITVDPTVQSQSEGLQAIQLVGQFETINSKAASVKIDLPAETSIENIVLNAIAQVTGAGIIKQAEINAGADGSIFTQNLNNVVLNNGTSITSNGTEITESISNNTSAELKTATLTPDSIAVTFDKFVAGLSEEDFDITATIDGSPVPLDEVRYDGSMKRIFFNPIMSATNAGKKLKVKVTPKNKLTGSTITTEEVKLQEGFSGRITDVSEVGIANATIKFRTGINPQEGEVKATATTDQYGYYWTTLPKGEYTGEISGDNLVTTYMYASVDSDSFKPEQNETAIATAASSEMKLVVRWGLDPRDVDSHLIGLNDNGKPFHVYYVDKQYVNNNGENVVDLDWDDTESYGPETTTFRKLKDGQYIFYLHKYAGESTLRKSDAKIEIYKGDSKQADQTMSIDPAEATEGKESYLIAYGIEISNNGQQIQLIPIKKFEKNIDIEGYTNLKPYLLKLISTGDDYLKNNPTIDTKDKIEAALTEAKNVDTNSANFETLLKATVALKVALNENTNLYQNEEYEWYDSEDTTAPTVTTAMYKVGNEEKTADVTEDGFKFAVEQGSKTSEIKLTLSEAVTVPENTKIVVKDSKENVVDDDYGTINVEDNVVTITPKNGEAPLTGTFTVEVQLPTDEAIEDAAGNELDIPALTLVVEDTTAPTIEKIKNVEIDSQNNTISFDAVLSEKAYFLDNSGEYLPMEEGRGSAYQYGLAFGVDGETTQKEAYLQSDLKTFKVTLKLANKIEAGDYVITFTNPQVMLTDKSGNVLSDAKATFTVTEDDGSLSVTADHVENVTKTQQ